VTSTLAEPQTSTAAAVTRPERQRGRVEASLLQASLAITLLFVLGIGFVVYLYGLSALSEHRTQTNLRKTFAHSLGQAIAPVGPVAQGTPVAVVQIPQIGLTGAVVVEGTSASDLTNGPGHRPDSVLPGQVGVSVIYGRRVSYGAPFAHLLRLRVGDRIRVTTGQGVATYRVSSFGDGTHPAPANSTNRLVLITAGSSASAHDTVSVSADLLSTPQPSSGVVGAAGDDQKAGATGVDDALVPALLWSQGLLLLAFATVYAAARWSRIAVYLCATPMLVAILWSLYENVSILLPNIY
jgi:sortase A